MEKCTYCTQRINRAKIDAKLATRELRDGDVKTACQQACPASAIEFGDLRDRSSRVVKAKADPRNYALLEELNTSPGRPIWPRCAIRIPILRACGLRRAQSVRACRGRTDALA